jgi:hypothetical protein
MGRTGVGVASSASADGQRQQMVVHRQGHHAQARVVDEVLRPFAHEWNEIPRGPSRQALTKPVRFPDGVGIENPD